MTAKKNMKIWNNFVTKVVDETLKSIIPLNNLETINYNKPRIAKKPKSEILSDHYDLLKSKTFENKD